MRGYLNYRLNLSLVSRGHAGYRLSDWRSQSYRSEVLSLPKGARTVLDPVGRRWPHPLPFHEKAGVVKFFSYRSSFFFHRSHGVVEAGFLASIRTRVGPRWVRCRLGSGGRDYLSDELRLRLAPAPCSQERSSSPDADPHRRPRPNQKFSLSSLSFFTLTTFFIG